LRRYNKDLASSYEAVISSRARDAIKNDAIYVTFYEYFQAGAHTRPLFSST
jgi:hypothetical protein